MIYIDPDGQVFPCCFWATSWYDTIKSKVKGNMTEKKLIDRIPLFEEYIERVDDFNVEKKPLTEILSDPLLNKKLEDSFEDPDMIADQCIMHCSSLQEVLSTKKRYKGRTPYGNSTLQEENGEYVKAYKSGKPVKKDDRYDER